MTTLFGRSLTKTYLCDRLVSNRRNISVLAMYAVVEIAGQQFKVSANQRLYVHRLEGVEESSVKFDKVLLVDREGAVKVGNPNIQGASVTAKIVSHVKGDKVIVFKKKRRKGYKVKNGHRQCFTLIEVSSIEA